MNVTTWRAFGKDDPLTHERRGTVLTVADINAEAGAAREFAPRKIHVNAICRGLTDTPMIRWFVANSPGVEKVLQSTTPSGRLGRPEEIAEAAVWLCSDAGSYVSGESMLVDGASVCR